MVRRGTRILNLRVIGNFVKERTVFLFRQSVSNTDLHLSILEAELDLTFTAWVNNSAALFTILDSIPHLI